MGSTVREMLNCAAVKMESQRRKGYLDVKTEGVMIGLSQALAVTTGERASALRARATERARELMSTGQDIQRELDLYKHLVSRFD